MPFKLIKQPLKLYKVTVADERPLSQGVWKTATIPEYWITFNEIGDSSFGLWTGGQHEVVLDLKSKRAIFKLSNGSTPNEFGTYEIIGDKMNLRNGQSVIELFRYSF